MCFGFSLLQIWFPQMTNYVEIGLWKAGKCHFSNDSGVCKGLQFAFDTTVDTNFWQNCDFSKMSSRPHRIRIPLVFTGFVWLLFLPWKWRKTEFDTTFLKPPDATFWKIEIQTQIATSYTAAISLRFHGWFMENSMTVHWILTEPSYSAVTASWFAPCCLFICSTVFLLSTYKNSPCCSN